MVHFRLLILGLLFTLNLNAQTFTEKIALKACDCVDLLDSYNQLQDSLTNCISNAMADVTIESSPDEKKIISTAEGIKNLFQEVNDLLPSYCYNVRKLIIEEKKQQFYKLSSLATANEHYYKGNEYIDKGDYGNSTIEFQEAIKIDNNFVYAIDHLALSFRRQDNYKKAIKYYQKSLDIFPEGNVALLNIAVAYLYLEDYDNSLKYYQSFIFLYQDDPEGYFGAGKVLFLKSDYENALENIFIAHRIYEATKSDYIKDSEKLIGIMYSELKEKGKLDLFYAKAKEFNISINE